MLIKHGPKLWALTGFDQYFGVRSLRASKIVQPPSTPSIPIIWAKLLYSLLMTQGRDGNMHHIAFGTVRQLRSAPSLYYALDMENHYP